MQPQLVIETAMKIRLRSRFQCSGVPCRASVDAAQELHDPGDVVLPVEQVDLFTEGVMVLGEAAERSSVVDYVVVQNIVGVEEHVFEAGPSGQTADLPATEDAFADGRRLVDIGIEEKPFGKTRYLEKFINQIVILQKGVDPDKIEADAVFEIQGEADDLLSVEVGVLLDDLPESEIAVRNLFFYFEGQNITQVFHILPFVPVIRTLAPAEKICSFNDWQTGCMPIIVRLGRRFIFLFQD
jgi:hypothetical protein